MCACLQTDRETALPGKKKRARETERKREKEKYLPSAQGGELVYTKTEKRHMEENGRS